MTAHDRRLHAFRPDLADVRLQGQVDAERFVAGRPARIAVPRRRICTVRPGPMPAVNTQILIGDDVTVFDEAEGWAWVQAERDGYVGYVARHGARRQGPGCDACGLGRRAPFSIPAADLKLPHEGELSLGAAVDGDGHGRDARHALCAAVFRRGDRDRRHLKPVGEHCAGLRRHRRDAAQHALSVGRHDGFGIDCSGLVQLSMRMTGQDVLRDTDMQAGTIGEPVDPGAGFSGLRRGDLVFWKGHVAIMTDRETIIHASGHTMLVSREGLSEAVERIGYLYGGPTGFRRP